MRLGSVDQHNLQSCHLTLFSYATPKNKVWGPPSVRLGFVGAPIATAVSFNLIAIATAAYILLYDPRTAWHPISLSMFHNLGLLVRLGLAGVGRSLYSSQMLGTTALLVHER